MVLEFCTLIFILPVLFGVGSFFEVLFGKNIQGISGTLLSGVFFITVFWSGLAFFFPLGIYTEAGTIILGLLLFFYFLKFKNICFSRRDFLIFSVFLVFFLLAASFSPYILDHFGYYLPSVKWLREFGFVKGISNIDLTLGQMSFWHIFQAGFSNFADPCLRINIIAVIISLFYALEKKMWLHFIFLPLYFLYLQSPSPDLPAMVFGLIILNEILIQNHNSGWLFALSIFVFGIKPTMVWLPIIVALHGFIILKSHGRFLFLGGAVFGLYVVKNLWLFGYPVFPMQAFDLNLPWKPKAGYMRQSAEFAIMKTYDMRYSYAEIKGFSIEDYIKNWLFLPGIKGRINLLFILVLLGFSAFSFMKNKKVIWIIFFGIFLKSVFILSFSAQYRFFTDVFIAVFFIVFYKKFSGRIIVPTAIFLCFSMVFIMSFPIFLQRNIPSFRVGKYMKGFSWGQLVIPGNYVINRYKTFRIGNLEFNVTEGYPYNYDTGLPAISPFYLKQNYRFGIFPQKIDGDLKSGFVSKKISGEERNSLGKIIGQLEEKP